jgi:hypothetical protein
MVPEQAGRMSTIGAQAHRPMPLRNMKMNIHIPHLHLDIHNPTSYSAHMTLTIRQRDTQTRSAAMFEYHLFFPNPPSDDQPRTRRQPGMRGDGAKRVVRPPETRPAGRAAASR